MERDIGGGSDMIRKGVAALLIAGFALAASGSKTTQRRSHPAHPC